MREILYTECPVRVGCNSCDTAFEGYYNDALICTDVTYSFAVAVTDFLDTGHLLSCKFKGIYSLHNSSIRSSAN